MKKGQLKALFIEAKGTGQKYIGVMIRTEGSSEPEVIINPKENFNVKFDYYMAAYGIPVLSRQDDSAGKHHVELHTESQPCRKERENHMVRCNRNSVIHGLLEQYRHIRHVPAKGQALCEC